MSLRGFQTALGRLVRARTATDSTRRDLDPLDGLDLTLDERGRVARLADSPGFQFTVGVQRSWCEGRAASAAHLVLSIFPVEQRRQIVNEWVSTGGGTAPLVASEAEAFLEFIARRLPEPSHALTLCRMEQAVYRASEAAAKFMPTELSMLDEPEAVLCASGHAAIVRFFAEPQRLLAAVNEGLPLPLLSEPPYPMLFAPGLPGLFRPAGSDEVALWEKLSRPVTMRALLDGHYASKTIEALVAVGAAVYGATINS
jgi:hypothetical protein